MVIARTTHPRLEDLLGAFPAVALLGPRQAGSTTLACEDVKATGRFVAYPGRERYRLDRSTEAVPLSALLQEAAG